MPIVPDANTSSGYSYTPPIRPKAKRVWLAIIVCGIVAGVTVTIFGLISVLIAQMILPSPSLMSSSHSDPVQGIIMAVMLSLYNLILFPIVLPATWGGLALTLGRMRWKGKTNRRPYYIAGMVLGAALVGLTTGFFGMIDNIVIGIFAALTGFTIGALAGAFSTFIFLAISQPARLLSEEAADVFG